MHHLARHSVACFLTRGDLYISWEEGKAVFEELLLDAVRGVIMLHSCYCVKFGVCLRCAALKTVGLPSNATCVPPSHADRLQ
jgi:hypothetical protein